MRLSHVMIGMALVLLVSPVVLSLWSRQRPELGVSGGMLGTCGPSPNCVSSVSRSDDFRIEHLPLKTPEGRLLDEDEAMAGLLQMVEALPRATIVEQGDAYLRVEIASSLMGYRDDLEFYVDSRYEIVQVRSASRVGYSDFGVNRRRVADLAAAWSRILES